MKTSPVAALVVVALGVVAALVLRSGRELPTPVPGASAAAMSKARLVELGSTTCASCKAMHQELALHRDECGESLAIEESAVWRDDEAARRYGVQVIPTQVFLDASGKEVDRHVGFLARAELRERSSRHGA